MKMFSTILSLVVASSPLYAGSGETKTIVVERADDSTDGVCERDSDLGLNCNLRAAIAEALKQDNSVIDIRVDSTIELGSIPIAPEQLTQLSIRGLDGSPQRKISGNGQSRLFDIAENSRVNLTGLEISKFKAINGAAIWNDGELTLTNVTFLGNQSSCSAIGAMTASATCFGGAILNSKTLVLKDGTRFEKNSVSASAGAASYTTAYASGGAIASSGKIIFDGDVVFEGNSATAEANSGVHPAPIGGATATAFGGAISGGSVEILENGLGKCVFARNVAQAEGSSPNDKVSLTSRGGATFASSESLALLNTCLFDANEAAVDDNLSSAD